MSQEQDLIAHLLSVYVADGAPAGSEVQHFVTFCQKYLGTLGVVGLAPAARGLALQLADGTTVTLAPQTEVHQSLPENGGAYPVIGVMPDRRGIAERPSDKPIFGK